MALLLLTGVTQTCGEDEPATPLAPTPKPTPLHLAEVDSLVWESDLGQDTGLDDHNATALIQIGFPFEFYGTVRTEVYVDTHGNLHFDDSASFFVNSFPLNDQPPMIAPFFEHLALFDHGTVYYNLLDDPPQRRLVVTWFQVPYAFEARDPGEWSTFQVQLFESTNLIQFGYNGLFKPPPAGGGKQVNVGIALDEIEYIAAEWRLDSLDMRNICYYPEDDAYEESMGPCVPCPPRPWFRDATFRDALRDLWESSNPVTDDQDPSTTSERGAWIVEEGDSYGLETEGVEPVAEYGNCATDFQPPPPPPTVARIHTHPWANGEYDGICGRETGKTVVMKYSHEMSNPDLFWATFYKQNYGISFDYIVYAGGGVLEYEPVPGQIGHFSRFPRCLQ